MGKLTKKINKSNKTYNNNKKHGSWKNVTFFQNGHVGFSFIDVMFPMPWPT